MVLLGNEGYEMNKKIILIISLALVFFVAITVVAKSFCNPAKEDAASGVTSFVEKNIPKPTGMDISNMRTSWILFFSKFCGNDAANHRF